MSAIQQVLASFAAAGGGGGSSLTWNPADKSASINLTNGNRTATTTSGTNSARGTLGQSSGKWQYEITCGATGTTPVYLIGVGNSSASLSQFPGQNTNSVSYYASSGNFWYAGSDSAYGATYIDLDVIGVVVDFTASSITFYKNGVSQGAKTGSFPTGTLFPMIGGVGNPEAYTINSTLLYPVGGASVW